MDISKIFVKSKQFLFRNWFLLIISTFITAPISIIASVAFYTLAEKAYSFKNLLFTAPIAFILLIWIVWFFLKIVLSQTVINNIKENWKGILILYLVLLPILNKHIPVPYSSFIKPNFKYEVEITPSEASSGSICIVDLKNSWGHINEVNDSIFDLQITGAWKRNINNCQFFIDKSKTGAIKFNNIGPFNDKLTFISGAYPGAGQLLIRTNTSPEKFVDLYSSIYNQRKKVIELSPNFLFIFLGICWLSPIIILLIPFYLVPWNRILSRSNELLNNNPKTNRIFGIFNPIFIFLITLIVAGYFSTIGVDPHHDGILLKPALDMVSGKILFKETFTQYGALTTIIQALALKIFGSYLITIRLLTAFFYALISLLLYFIFKRFLPMLVLLFSLFIWLFMAPYYSATFLPWSSIYALFFQLLATYLFIIFFEKKSRGYFILASISTALIFWYRQPVGVFTFLAIIVYFAYLYITKQIKKQVFYKHLVNFLFVNFLVSLIFIIYFILNHSLIDWWKQSISFAFTWSQGASDGFNVLSIINDLLPSSYSPLSIWTLIPISTLLLGITNLKSKLLSLPIFIGLSSWLQYYPVEGIRHQYWAATPMIPLFCLFIYQLCQHIILPKFHLQKNIAKYLAVLITIISFLPDISFRVKSGLLKINASYQYLEQPAVLKGMKMTPDEANFYQYLSQEITNYFEKNPQGNVVTNGPNALYLTFDSRIYNIQPMYVNWGRRINNGIYPNYSNIFYNYLERENPFLISHDDKIPSGYCRLDEISNYYADSLSQPCPEPN